MNSVSLCEYRPMISNTLLLTQTIVKKNLDILITFFRRRLVLVSSFRKNYLFSLTVDLAVLLARQRFICRYSSRSVKNRSMRLTVFSFESASRQSREIKSLVDIVRRDIKSLKLLRRASEPRTSHLCSRGAF